MKRQHILHIITDLDTGGAEMMLYKLLASMTERNISSSVICLMGNGPVSQKIEALGVTVYSLGLNQGQRPALKHVMKLLSLVRQLSPSTIQGWMYHGNIAATVAKLFAFVGATLFWNVRQTLYKFENEKPMTQRLIKFSAKISCIPKKIIYNSSLSMQQHVEVGFSKKNTLMIPNGFDISLFQPDEGAGLAARQQLGLNESDFVVGHVSRYHPMKDHELLLQAALNVVAVHPEVKFLLIGRGVDQHNEHLVNKITDLHLNHHVIVLGERQDIPALTNSFDLAVLSSAWGEGFPNAIGEAMACAIPCVVTSVGDSAHIVGDTGIAVDIANVSAFASAVVEMVELEPVMRKAYGQAARERVLAHFSIHSICDEYSALYNVSAMT